jgi:quinol monooxygenase YgiN
MSQNQHLAAVVSHSVSNFDQWKRVFDSDQAARKSAGFLGHHINHAAGDPNRIATYLPLSDRARAQAFMVNPDLKATMSRAGVTGAPEVVWIESQESTYIADRPTAAMLISHEVEDYAAWKKVYDTFASTRTKAGIIGAAVNRSLDNPNVVLVYHQAETNAHLEAFTALPELKAAMKQGGVKGAPVINYLQALAGATY